MLNFTSLKIERTEITDANTIKVDGVATIVSNGKVVSSPEFTYQSRRPKATNNSNLSYTLGNIRINDGIGFVSNVPVFYRPNTPLYSTPKIEVGSFRIGLSISNPQLINQIFNAKESLTILPPTSFGDTSRVLVSKDNMRYVINNKSIDEIDIDTINTGDITVMMANDNGKNIIYSPMGIRIIQTEDEDYEQVHLISVNQDISNFSNWVVRTIVQQVPELSFEALLEHYGMNFTSEDDDSELEAVSEHSEQFAG